ncbi:CPBP family intramembrane glutamic endopeptidase [Roseivirga sp.]|uniref:CPBP family intramembrane glutamic endopeptidase n=1 Tax=Roseivirga sp. TaxID=1964215 RepID=UPI003B51CED7
MTRLDKGIDITGGRSERASFLIVLGFLIVGFFVGQFVGAIAAFVFAFSNGADMATLMSDPNAIYDHMSLTQVLVSQIGYTLIFTFVTPWFYLKVLANKSISVLSNEKGVSAIPLILTVLATAAFMVVNSIFIEWNENFHFPEFMSGFEQWAREMEDQLAEATERFTTFNNIGEFIFGLIAISILPGIGEEIMFRGVLQNSLHRLAKNKHVAIWISAFIFGAIHMQFFGLLPRMMLGAAFGYLYVWSGNIWYPIIAHAVNNGIGVILAYSAQFSESEVNLDDTETVPLVWQIIAAVFFVAFMVLFRNQYLRSKSQE